MLSAAEVEAVLVQSDLATPLGVRDRALLEVLYSAGIRRLELIHLTLQDVDPLRGVCFVREGKGQKDRVVPIGQRALDWIERYLTRRGRGWSSRPTTGCCSSRFAAGPSPPTA